MLLERMLLSALHIVDNDWIKFLIAPEMDNVLNIIECDIFRNRNTSSYVRTKV